MPTDPFDDLPTETRRRDRRPSDDGNRRTRRRRAALVWGWITGAVLLVAGAIGVVSLAFLQDAGEVRNDLLAAQSKLSFVPQIVANGDIAGLQQVAGEVQALTQEARAGSEGPLWDAASRIPGVRENVVAVQQLTAMTDDLTTRALPAAVDLLTASDFSSIAVEGGGIDLEPFRQAQGALPEISAAFADAQATVGGIDRDGLLPLVTEPLDQVSGIVDQAAPSLALLQKYLPALLRAAGDGGPRTYLVIFQNNAEIRATGGNPAASSILRVENGRMQLADQSNSQSFYEAGTIGTSYVDLPAETRNLYLETITQYSQDYTFTPDFPTTAALFQALWAETDGSQFDGIISIDPVVLSHILEVLGPVDLATGEQITAENAVQLLLSDAYERYGDLGDNGQASDVFFADVAATVFAKLAGGQWDPIGMFEQFTRSAEEQRVNLWFADAEAQALVSELHLDGGLETDNASSTQVGLYLNDYSVSKLEYHLHTAVAVSCDPGARTVTVIATLQNTIPDGIDNAYTLGARNGRFDIAPTSMMLDALFFAPPGATITALDPADGDIPALSRSGVEKGNTAESRMVVLDQGATRTVSFTVTLPEGELGPLRVRHTPTASVTDVVYDPSCDPLRAPAS